MVDVPLIVVSDSTQSERRITPSWTISQLKAKLEHITGVPPSAQLLYLATAPARDSPASSGSKKNTDAGTAGMLSPSTGAIPVTAADEDATQLAQFPLVAYAELRVVDTRPQGARLQLQLGVDSGGNVDKYVMPEEEYAAKTDSVLAWKRAQKLGRFDPEAPEHVRARIAAFAAEAKARGIAIGKRCRIAGDDMRRGVVRYVGEVPEIGQATAAAQAGHGSGAALPPSTAGTWVGVELDEPVGGKNDGSIGGKRYWGEDAGSGQAMVKRGVFVRPERVEVGDAFGVLDNLEDMEEI